MEAEANAGSFKDHFSGHAAEYAEHRPTYPAALAELLAELSPGRDLALDCGCGSGQLSVLLAERFAGVVATDASAEQIANAFAHPRVEYRVAPADHSGLADGSADLVVAAQAAHWFDMPAYWREVDRVARAGALVALAGYALCEIDPAVDAVIRPFHDVWLGPYWPPERQMVEDGYAGMDFPYERLPAPELQMTASWTMDQFARYLSTWSGVKEAERATGRSPLPELLDRMRRAWGDPEQPRDVRWPLFLHLGRAGRRP